MICLFHFIYHGNRIIFYRNMAVPIFINNKVILAQTEFSGTPPWLESSSW